MLFSVLLLALTISSFSQENHIEAPKNSTFQISKISLGSETVGINVFSASVVNTAASEKNLVIDLRTECAGLSLSNWERQFFFVLEPKKSTKIELEYEIATPLLTRIILSFGESEKYFDREKWQSLSTKEQEKNPPPKVNYFVEKVISREVYTASDKTVDDFIQGYTSCLNRISKDKLGQIKSNLPSLIKRSREEENSLRRKLFNLFRIDRKNPKDYDFRDSKWSSDSQYLNSLLKRNKVDARVFSIAGDAGNRITAFIAVDKKDFDKKKPLIILLSGNPPGTKESLVNSAIYFCRLGYCAVGVDRRPTSRILDKKEKFLTNFSDPVFDTLRLLGFLKDQSEFSISKIGIYGFSAGAWEAKFVAALDNQVGAVVLACGITSHNWMFKNWAWFPSYSGMIIFPELGLGNPDIASLSTEQFKENFDKLRPEHNQMAREIFNKVFPYFEDLDPTKITSLIAPVPLMVITGAQDDQFMVPGVVEVDEALQSAYQAYGLRSCSELYIQPRAGHHIDSNGGSVIAAFFDRWLK